MKSPSIIFTGGGSGGHLFPLVALAQFLKMEYPDWKLIYFGSRQDNLSIIKNHFSYRKMIQVGKLRRYFSWQNFFDFFKFILGIIQSLVFIRQIKPQFVFSTGGYVGLPVVIAGWLLRKPIIIHEQTSRVGLANHISAKLADQILISFESSKDFFNSTKTVWTGFPLRLEFYDEGIKIKKKLSLDTPLIQAIQKTKRKIILIGGGANGSREINDLVEKYLEEIKKKYFIIHQLGSQSSHLLDLKSKNYYPVTHLFDFTWIFILQEIELYIGRSGAGTVHELMFLNKPAIFIPLKIAQKNEQFHNAKEYQRIHSIHPQVKIIHDVKNFDLIKDIDEFCHRKLLKKILLEKYEPHQKITEVFKKYLAISG